MINIYVGEDPYYTYLECKKDIEKNYSLNQIEVYKYDALLDPIETVLDNCMTYSFFNTTKIIIYDRCTFLSSSNKDKKDKSDYINKLISFSEIKDDSIVLNLIVTPSLAKNESVKTLMQNSNVRSVNSLSEQDFFIYINKLVHSQNKTITSEATYELMHRCINENNKIDFLMIENNVNKLCLATDNINIVDVELLIYKPLEDKIFNLSTSLLKNQTVEAIKIFRDLLSLGYQVFTILPFLYSSFSFIARVKYLYSLNHSDEEIRVLLEEKSIFRIKYGIKDGAYISYKSLNNILSDLSKIENDIKFNGVEAESSIEYFILNFKDKYILNK